MTSEQLVLLPIPRRMTVDGGICPLAGEGLIVLDCPAPQAVLLAAAKLQDALSQHLHATMAISASTAVPAERISVYLTLDPKGQGGAAHEQGYDLRIVPEGVTIRAHEEAGMFYAICTLVQIVQQSRRALPCLTIADWPDFAARGVMLDISRDKIPTMETLFDLVDMLASWKINQLQLYTENAFAYRRHPLVWANTSPITGQEAMALDQYCRQRYVELVPNQNSFGHMQRWLVHPQYTPLGEGAEPNCTLCPTDPASLEFISGLYDELLPHFSSGLLNVGCDETQVGEGRSKAECERRGAGRVYLDFLLGIYREVSKRGHTMQFWGDIIMKYPALIPELPKDIVALEWGYDANHPFAEHSARFAESGIPFYVCPGTSTWNALAGRTDNCLANTLNAAENGLRNGACGYLNTDWGDHGHWQVLPVSYLGYAAGAAYSWAVDSNRQLDVARTLDVHAFADAAGVMGSLVYEMGNVYKAAGAESHNSSLIARVLQIPLSAITTKYPQATAAGFLRAIEATDAAVAPLSAARMARPDADLIVAELANTARLMRHGCFRALLALAPAGAAQEGMDRELSLDMAGIIQEYSRLWLARNRPGGLADSTARLHKARADYNWAGYRSTLG